jgi:hypothetical protein
MARDVDYMGYFKQRTSDAIIITNGSPKEGRE